MTDHLSARYQSLVQSLITLLESRNPYNVEHCKLVAHYSDALAARVDMDPTMRDHLKSAAEIHTLGVLLQMEEKRPHQSLPITRLGLCTGREQPMHRREEEILHNVLDDTVLAPAISIIVQRHEWFDGSGSIFGLSGERILPAARALAVADAFVDLATPKSHRDPMTLTEVLRRVQAQSGTQYDPRMVEALMAVVADEEGRWGASARARRFETARCRHWIGLGDFYRKTGEYDWSLRCYLAGQRLARHMADVELELDAVSGQFMVVCDLGQLERARDILNQVRKQVETTDGKPRQRFLLMWGWLEWLSGRAENGQQILQGLCDQYTAERDVAGLATVVALQCTTLLWSRGLDDAEHLRWLHRFMEVIDQHDLFDVVERSRPHTIPLLLSAVIHGVKPTLARSILTRMGEPCHEALRIELSQLQPPQWMSKLRPAEESSSATPVAAAAVPPLAARAAVLQVLLLGRCRLEFNGRKLLEEDWPTQKAMKLFAFLACRRNATVSDEVLMDSFWPESDPERARNSLRNALHQIRTVLKDLLGPEGWVLDHSRKSHTLALRAEYFLDTEALEASVQAASAHLARQQAAEALKVLEGVLPLCRGEFMEGSNDEWVQGLRTHLAESHLRGMHLLCRCHLELGDPEAAELVARKALSLDDLREDLHAALIESLTRQGRRADGLRHYQDAVAHFRKELGLLPSSLSDIYDRHLRESPIA